MVNLANVALYSAQLPPPRPPHYPLLPAPAPVGCAGRNVFAEELESAHQLAEFTLPGLLHDPVRECSSEETGSIKMHYT